MPARLDPCGLLDYGEDSFCIASGNAHFRPLGGNCLSERRRGELSVRIILKVKRNVKNNCSSNAVPVKLPDLAEPQSCEVRRQGTSPFRDGFFRSAFRSSPKHLSAPPCD